MPRRFEIAALAVLLVLALAAPAAARPLCGTPDALAGHLPDHAPIPTSSTGREDGKGLLYQPLSGRLDGKNVSVQWAGDDGDAAMAGVLVDALEAGWQALIGEQGWPAPAGGDDYLLLVVLDPSIEASGLTAEFAHDDVPEGAPVIYIHPDNIDNEPFFRSVAVHELHHAIQYRMRGSWAADDAEAWYWEASAEWAAERAAPDLDMYANSAQWFTQRPFARFDSQFNFHQYGMFLLNAWLEEEQAGPDAMRAVWERAGEGDPWDELLVDVAGLEAPQLWAGFVGAVGQETLRESSLYMPVAVSGPVTGSLTEELPYLGARFYSADRDGRVRAEGDVLLTAPGGVGIEVPVESGDLVAAVGRTDGAVYTLAYVDSDTDGGPEPPGGRACNGPAAALLLLGPCALRRRRITS